MKNILCLVIMMILFSSNAISKNPQIINIYYFKSLSNSTDEVLFLKNELDGKKSRTIPKYNINFINYYTKVKTSLETTNEIYFLPKVIENKIFKENKEILSDLMKLEQNSLVTFNPDITSPVKFGKTYTNIKDLINAIKKNKNNEINIIWFNGFVTYYYSPENIKKVYYEHKERNDLSKIIPKIITPFVKEQLRPSSTHYEIIFEGVDLFDQYEVEINNRFGNLDFVRKVVNVLPKDQFSKDDIFMYKTGFGNKISLLLDQKYLGMECVRLFSEMSTPPDPTCDCIYLCLYERQFSIRIRGIVQGVEADDLWSLKIEPFFLQCPKKPKNE